MHNQTILEFFVDSSTDYIANAKLAQEAGQWGRNFDTKNPFKYESSDDEGPEPSMDQVRSKPSKATLSLERNDETFFAVNFPGFSNSIYLI